ncbi:hypothetical protein [Aquibacillus rhizosphaerae]|uniref:Permease n=1 Tax=Aquibacillus rhizosphaerae TaxID=3051431 RepID=A0ABT7L1V2_9BACI|nr:hypothetical protein [Aquibacillus sp. LR5S19]MDL4839803.1 hypothetical protein [Aquibacillus sp. LR5S19]
MKKLLQNEWFRKYGFFVSGLLLLFIGLLLIVDGKTSLPYRISFIIIAICGAIQVIATFISDKWKNTENLIKYSFIGSGYVLMGSAIWEHLVHGIIKVPIWGLVTIYFFFIVGFFTGIATVIDRIKGIKSRNSTNYG